MPNCRSFANFAQSNCKIMKHGDLSNIDTNNPCINNIDACNTVRLTLRKGEKLRHRSLVENLFKEGSSIYEFPIRLTWRAIDGETLRNTFRDHVPQPIDTLQMLITVPKKKRRHAVDRVLMRRRIREAYRLNRKEFLGNIEDGNKTRTLSMAFIYLHDKNLPYAIIERKIRLLLKKLAGKISSQQDKTDFGDSTETV